MRIACKFSELIFYNRTYYLCNVENKEIPENQKLLFKGKHVDGKTYNDVTAICFENCIITKVPQGLTKSLPNMKVLEIRSSNLMNISNADLAEYRHLERFVCSRNPIEFLPGNLFEDFEKLEWILLNDNKLKLIEPDIFDGLKNLQLVNLRRNTNYDIFHQNFPRSFLTTDGDHIASLTEVKIDLMTKLIASGAKNVMAYLIHSRGKIQNLKKSKQESDKKVKELSDKIQKDEAVLHNQDMFKLIREVNGFKENGVFNDIKSYIQNEKFKDFKVKIDNREYHVHKLLLSIRSPTLSEMLRNNPEAQSLELIDIPIGIFEVILNFLYTDELACEDGINYLHVFAAANRLRIKKLKDLAVEIILNQLNFENALEVLEMANKYEHDILRQKAYEQFQTRFRNIEFKEEWAIDTEKVTEMVEMAKNIEEFNRLLMNFNN